MSWVCLLVSIILFLAAMFIPILYVQRQGHAPLSLTAAEIVTSFWGRGLMLLAAIACLVNIVLPTLRFAVFTALLVADDYAVLTHAPLRARVHRWLRLLERWMALDLFATFAVAACLQLDPRITASPGTGLYFLWASSVLAFVSVIRFDSRRIWNA